MNVHFVEVSGHNLESSQSSEYNVYTTNQFQPLLLRGGGGEGVNPFKNSASGKTTVLLVHYYRVIF
jgi:hypothetical protein